MRILTAIFFALVLGGSTNAESLPPFDEAGSDPVFARFRAMFIEIVSSRDLASFEEHLHPNIKMSLGNGTGIPAAMRIMREERSRWDRLERVLRSGGKFKTVGHGDQAVRMFFAPYTYFAKPNETQSLHELAVVVGRNVNVRAGPSKTARVVARLSHWVVRAFPRTGGDDEWIKIRTPQNEIGYVNASYIAWPTDWRAGFEMHDRSWKLRVFLAGD